MSIPFRPVRPIGTSLEDALRPSNADGTSALPDLTVELIELQATAAAHRNTANGIEALTEDPSQLDALVDRLVRLSPLPNWLDRMVIGYAVRFLAPAIRQIADELEAQATPG